MAALFDARRTMSIHLAGVASFEVFVSEATRFLRASSNPVFEALNASGDRVGEVTDQASLERALSNDATQFVLVSPPITSDEEDYEFIDDDDLVADDGLEVAEDGDNVVEDVDVEDVEDVEEEDPTEEDPAEEDPAEEDPAEEEPPLPRPWRVFTCQTCSSVVGLTRKEHATCKRCPNATPQETHLPQTHAERAAVADRAMHCPRCRKEIGIKRSMEDAAGAHGTYECTRCSFVIDAQVVHAKRTLRKKAKKLKHELRKTSVCVALLTACHPETYLDALPVLAPLLGGFPELKPFARAVLKLEREEESVEKAEAPPQQHWEGVMCAGCGESAEARATSVAQGTLHPTIGHIIGDRYHSSVVKEKDICGTCEQAGIMRHLEPFLKLRCAEKVPVSITCVLPEDSFLDVVADGDVRATCPAGHALRSFEAPNRAYECDECRARVPCGTPLHGCRTCNYDVCANCCCAVAPTQEWPDMVHVADLSFPDGGEVLRGSLVTKKWKIKNSSRTAWPSSTTLVFVGGQSFPGVGASVHVGALEGNSTTVAQITFAIPIDEATGRSVSYFRLGFTDDSGSHKFFGDRLWLDVQVSDESHSRATGVAKWQTELISLSSACPTLAEDSASLSVAIALLEEHAHEDDAVAAVRARLG